MYGAVPGIALIPMAFAIAFGSDGAAYFGGRAFGRHKLCPSVSPKKTVEGAAFGLLGGVLFALCCRLVFIHVFDMAMPRVEGTIVLGLIGSLAGQIGDLSASLLKRHSGIKDYGKLFPGPGGVMEDVYTRQAGMHAHRGGADFPDHAAHAGADLCTDRCDGGCAEDVGFNPEIRRRETGQQGAQGRGAFPAH